MQIRPDASLLSVLSEICRPVPMSGIPAQHAVGGTNLRGAAKAGGVSKIVAYWGTIEASAEPKSGMAVSWVPALGWYIPDQSQRMRVSVTAIVVDVESGRWSDASAVSDERSFVSSPVTVRTKDSREVVALKSQAYERLVEELFQH